MIDIDWGNREETILVMTFQEGWGAADWMNAIDQLDIVYSNAKQTIHLILDMQHSAESPSNLIHLTQLGLQKDKTGKNKVGIVTIISKTGFWKRIFDVVSRLVKVRYDVHFVSDTHEAYKIIESRISLFNEDTLPISTKNQRFVLYVEDNEMNQRLVKSMLRPYDCHILFADECDMALKLIDDFNPEVIIMDYHLQGGKDGAEITRLIKENPETQHIPVIALTADIYSRDTMMEAGCDVYLNKPIRRKLFIEALEPILIKEPTSNKNECL